MKILSMMFITLMVSVPAFADQGPGPDQAVMEYLRLMSEGKRHAQAVAIVSKEFNLTAEQLNAAAERISKAGLDVKPELVVLDRGPAKAKK